MNRLYIANAVAILLSVISVILSTLLIGRMHYPPVPVISFFLWVLLVLWQKISGYQDSETEKSDKGIETPQEAIDEL
jgi:hypothetical protein